jgi:hypothetical protein
MEERMLTRMFCSITVAISLVFAATPIAFAEPTRPVPTETRGEQTVRAAERQASKDAASDRDRYAERDRADDKTDKFEGGSVVVVAVSTTTLIIGLLLLVLIL